jgi:transcriptional regulatory protein LevR
MPASIRRGPGVFGAPLRSIRLKEAVSIDVFVGTLIATMLVFMAVGVVVLLAAGVEELAENLLRKKKKQQRETAGPES